MTTIATSHTPSRAHSKSPVGPLQPLQPKKDDYKLVIPHVPEELDPDDYELAHFWMQIGWNNHKKNQVNQGLNIKSLSFMCDADGDPVSKEHLATMMKRAKQLWMTCYHLHMDPPSWTKKTKDVSMYFLRNMCISFPKFALCERNWKAEAFAVIQYLDWASDVRGSGALTHELLFYSSFDSYIIYVHSSREMGKRKSDDTEKPAPKPKKCKVVMASVPLDATIISIDDDSDEVPPSNPVPPNVASSLSSPISIASLSSQGPEQSTLTTCSTAFTSGGLAETSSAALPTTSPFIDPSVSNREPTPSSKSAMTNEPASEPAASNGPASEPAISNEHAISNELSTPTTSNPPATSNEPGFDLKKTSAVSNEASSWITHRSHDSSGQCSVWILVFPCIQSLLTILQHWFGHPPSSTGGPVHCQHLRGTRTRQYYKQSSSKSQLEGTRHVIITNSPVHPIYINKTWVFYTRLHTAP